MAQPFIGEIKIAAFNFPPKGWALCNGQLLPINQNQALFSILGTMYGGNGQTNFGLPDLRGRIPVYSGPSMVLGQRGGEQAHTLIASELPSHNHPVNGSTSAPNVGSPLGATWATGTANAHANANPDTSMNPAAVGNIGGGQPHENMPPFLVLNFCIALQGIFPSRN